MENEKPRFTTVYEDVNLMQTHDILKDNVTGVLYFRSSRRVHGAGVGLTPLLGADGKPVIEPVGS